MNSTPFASCQYNNSGMFWLSHPDIKLSLDPGFTRYRGCLRVRFPGSISCQIINLYVRKGLPTLSPKKKPKPLSIDDRFSRCWRHRYQCYWNVCLSSHHCIYNHHARITKGKSPFDFPNPTVWIMKAKWFIASQCSTTPFASAINDITTGSNPGCGELNKFWEESFYFRTEGWDPVTGAFWSWAVVLCWIIITRVQVLVPRVLDGHWPLIQFYHGLSASNSSASSYSFHSSKSESMSVL